MEPTNRQMKDWEICTAIWRLLRDYGDAQPGQDAKWVEIVEKTDQLGRMDPFARSLTGPILAELETRSIGEEAAKERRAEVEAVKKEKDRAWHIYKRMNEDERKEIEARGNHV